MLQTETTSRFASFEADAVRNWLAIINPNHFIELPFEREGEVTLFWQATSLEIAADSFFKRLCHAFIVEANKEHHLWDNVDPPPAPHRLAQWPDNLETMFSPIFMLT